MNENHNKTLITIIAVTLVSICVVSLLELRKPENKNNPETNSSLKEITPLDEESENEEVEIEEEIEETEEDNDKEQPVSEQEENQEPKEEENPKKENVTKVIEKSLQLEIYSKEPTIKTLINENDSDYDITYYTSKNQKTTYKNITKTTGTYKVTLKKDNLTYERTIIIVDTTKPVLKLKKLSIVEKEKITVNDFITSCTDNSKQKCKITLLSKINTSSIGTTKIKIRAEDNSGNKTVVETQLNITKKETTTESKPTKEDEKTEEKPSTPPEPTLVETKKETSKEEISLPYGVKKILTKETTYDIYSDGSKKNYNTRVVKTEYDYSGYNGTTETLTKEAIENKTKYKEKANLIVSETNKYRTSANVNEVTLDENLTTAAMIRALELAYTGKLTHTRPNGTSTFTLLDELGIGYSYAGENIAYGYSTAESVTLGWKNSAGHYKNMISANYKKIGVGYANINGTPYWVQIFTN